MVIAADHFPREIKGAWTRNYAVLNFIWWTIYDFLQFGGELPVLTAYAVPTTVLWPNVTAVVFLAIGLLIIVPEVRQAQGLDKVLPFGRLFFAVPMAVFGADHFVFAQSIAPLVPRWIPAHLFWVYLVGVALFAAALSIIVKRYSKLAATLLGIMLFLFVVLMHIPGILAGPADRFAWAIGLRDLSFSGGAFALAGAQMKTRPGQGVPALVTIGRFFIGIAALFFGVEHFLHPYYVPGIPLDRLTPEWIPGRLFWAYAGGAVIFAAGAFLVANKNTRLAAICLGIIILLQVLFVYGPILAANLSSVDDGLNYFADTIAFSGAALLLADAWPRERDAHA